MADPNALDFLRIPTDTLIALDWRPFHFAMQRYHHLVRIAHIVSVSLFFGAVVLLDLRLTGVHRSLPLRPFAEHTLSWLRINFGMAVVSGATLFFYDPLHVGAHAYFTAKLAFIGLGLANAAVFHRIGYRGALAADGAPPLTITSVNVVEIRVWLW
jgi:hypothetical protein